MALLLECLAFGLLPAAASAESRTVATVAIDRAHGSSTSDQKTVVPITSGNPLWELPLRLLSATRDRPVFSPSRRPPPPPVVAHAAPPPPPPPKPAEPDHPLLTLVGTAVGSGETIAVFEDQTTKSVIRLEPGQVHDGWTLGAIRDRDVTFKRNELTASLLLPAANGAPASPGQNAWSGGGMQRPIPADAPKPPWLTAAQNPPPPAPQRPASGVPEPHTMPASGPKPPWLTAVQNPPVQPVADRQAVYANPVSPPNAPKPPWMSGPGVAGAGALPPAGVGTH
jgi:hypothetical protein